MIFFMEKNKDLSVELDGELMMAESFKMQQHRSYFREGFFYVKLLFNFTFQKL